MKTSRKQPALKLNRETLRQLNEQQLDLVVGASVTCSFCASACMGQTCVLK